MIRSWIEEGSGLRKVVPRPLGKIWIEIYLRIYALYRLISMDNLLSNHSEKKIIKQKREVKFNVEKF